jgi:hypothetical protein
MRGIARRALTQHAASAVAVDAQARLFGQTVRGANQWRRWCIAACDTAAAAAAVRDEHAVGVALTRARALARMRDVRAGTLRLAGVAVRLAVGSADRAVVERAQTIATPAA